jgi:hypothetical protein
MNFERPLSVGSDQSIGIQWAGFNPGALQTNVFVSPPDHQVVGRDGPSHLFSVRHQRCTELDNFQRILESTDLECVAQIPRKEHVLRSFCSKVRAAVNACVSVQSKTRLLDHHHESTHRKIAAMEMRSTRTRRCPCVPAAVTSG